MSSLDTTGGWIAVVGQHRDGLTRVPIPYLHAVELAGGQPRMLSTFQARADDVEPPEGSSFGLAPDDASCLDGASGLVIPGGGDIDPAWYGAERHPRTHKVSHRRDEFESTLMATALEEDIPIFAICHGMQLLNVHLGGTLEQHLADDPERLNHDRDRPRAEAAHEVRVKPGSILEPILGRHAAVNSHHHQGLRDVAGELEEIAWAEDDILEAVVSRDHTWVLGVQWHPEAMAPVDPKELALFREFVAAAARATPVGHRQAAQSA